MRRVAPRRYSVSDATPKRPGFSQKSRSRRRGSCRQPPGSLPIWRIFARSARSTSQKSKPSSMRYCPARRTPFVPSSLERSGSHFRAAAFAPRSITSVSWRGLPNSMFCATWKCSRACPVGASSVRRKTSDGFNIWNYSVIWSTAHPRPQGDPYREPRKDAWTERPIAFAQRSRRFCTGRQSVMRAAMERAMNGLKRNGSQW
jgi:hypothetical protein